MIKVYGIPNCGTVKKACSFFKENNINFLFHDFKKEGVTALKLKEWLTLKPIEILLNKKSTTWKLLSLDEKAQTDNKDGAIALLQQYPTLIKRPIVAFDKIIMVGFSDADYKATFLR